MRRFQTRRQGRVTEREVQIWRIRHTTKTFCRTIRFGKWSPKREERLFDHWLRIDGRRRRLLSDLTPEEERDILDWLDGQGRENDGSAR